MKILNGNVVAECNGWKMIRTGNGETYFQPPSDDADPADCPVSELLEAAKKEVDAGGKTR